MTNMVYGNPFGAALEGKRSALEDVLKAGTVARQQRGEDLDYGFRKWYDPYRRDEAQNDVGTKLLHSAALNQVSTGDPTLLNHIMQLYFGATPNAAYTAAQTPEQRSMGAAITGGLVNPAFQFPGFYVGSGQQRTGAGLPGSAPPAPMGPYGGDEELNAIWRAREKARLLAPNDTGDGLGHVPHMDPLSGLPTQKSPDVAPVWGDATHKPPSPMDAYGTPKQPGNSIWADEQGEAGG